MDSLYFKRLGSLYIYQKTKLMLNVLFTNIFIMYKNTIVVSMYEIMNI
jgi:hypothetical protein